MSNSRKTKTQVRKILRGNLTVLTQRGWDMFLNGIRDVNKPLPRKTVIDQATEKWNTMYV